MLNNALENTGFKRIVNFINIVISKCHNLEIIYKDNVLQYLRAVESYFNLDNHIKFNQNVKLIEYVNNALWNIKTENNKNLKCITPKIYVFVDITIIPKYPLLRII